MTDPRPRTFAPHRATATMAAVITVIMALALLLQLRITTGAFDTLESHQLAQDANRLRVSLEANLDSLRGSAISNSVWDDSYKIVRSPGKAGIASILEARDTHETYQVDGVLGVNSSYHVTTGGLIRGNAYVAPPAELSDPARLRRLLDVTATGGSRCGITVAAAVPYFVCGSPSLDTDHHRTSFAGLVFLRSLNADGLARLGKQTGMTLSLDAAANAKPETPVRGDVIGDIAVAVANTGHRAVINMAVPKLEGGTQSFSATRPREIHDRAGRVSRTLALMTGALGLLLFLVMTWMFRRGIARSVRPLIATLVAAAEPAGRDTRVAGRPDAPTSGPVGELGARIDTLLSAVSQHAIDMERSRQEREDAAVAAERERAAATEREHRRAAEQISAAGAEIRAELEEVIAGAQSVREVAAILNDTAQASSERSARLSQSAREGMGAATAIDQSLGSVRGVSALIASIAEQTNMLALNATIEASRAGEAGRGFAVVAGEVKNLAGSTTKSTEDIDRMSDRLEKDVRSLTAVVGDLAAGLEEAGGVARDLSAQSERQLDSLNALQDRVHSALVSVKDVETRAR